MSSKSLDQEHRKWLLPIVVAFIVFITSQAVIIGLAVFQDNPLPSVSLSQPIVLEHSMESVREAIVIDSTLEAEVAISRLGLDVPIVWSTSIKEDVLQKDLEHGAVHYPGTPEPGNFGNAFVTAHSSDYPWKKGTYKQAFARLGKLAIGDDDILVIYKKDGIPVYQATFKVYQKEVVKYTDERMIKQADRTEMTLVTCWPVGTNWRRLMVKMELVSLEAI